MFNKKKWIYVSEMELLFLKRNKIHPFIYIEFHNINKEVHILVTHKMQSKFSSKNLLHSNVYPMSISVYVFTLATIIATISCDVNYLSIFFLLPHYCLYITMFTKINVCHAPTNASNEKVFHVCVLSVYGVYVLWFIGRLSHSIVTFAAAYWK